MSHPLVHANNSVKVFGGKPSDYLQVHQWFDDSKSHMADMRHRALKHHSAGIFECEKVFGMSIENSDGKIIYTRYIGEQHIIEDLGFIPTLNDWFENMEMQKWMMNTDSNVKRITKKREKLPKSLVVKNNSKGE